MELNQERVRSYNKTNRFVSTDLGGITGIVDKVTT